ncbi:MULTISPECIES: signal peptidase II [unclassified Butyrivibrio]|uniref:signal peptidase II n=1 Tax=unclassified Butyrivibrio TaxID=2639466 RepID=UPI0003B49774|nr:MULTISPECIES: signal peptidase II [unclassified Butyrivibrio]MDC7295224.1 signal peptidase II [Butyrivibrio sp. DSM 10294]
MNTMSKKKKIFLVVDVLLIVLLTFLDQFTKHLAVMHLQDKPPIKIINGVLELNFLKNSGAAFGMLQNQKVFFVLVATLILLIIGYVLFRIPDDKKYNILHILLAMIASGAAGNMIDRVKQDYVVDFIYFVLINFPIFNVADIYVTVSTFFFVILFLFYYKESDFSFLSFRQQNKFREFK